MSDSEFMLLKDTDYDRRQRNHFLVKVLVFGFVFILGFVCITFFIADDIPALKRPQFKSQCSLAYAYDYNLLTLRWPTSICEDQNCTQYKADEWLIHGLWPTYNNNSWPQFCCFDREFNVKNLDPIKDQLLDVWQNLEEGMTTDSLWAHEWTKHGTCTKTKQIDYFNNTLNLYKTLPVFQWLQDSGISPDNQKTYSLDAFQKVFVEKIGHKVEIKCSNIKSTGSKKRPEKVTEISICVTHDSTLQVIDCPQSSTCHKPFYYPKAEDNSTH